MFETLGEPIPAQLQVESGKIRENAN
jgi:hypothetical protein